MEKIASTIVLLAMAGFVTGCESEMEGVEEADPAIVTEPQTRAEEHRLERDQNLEGQGNPEAPGAEVEDSFDEEG